MNTKTLSLPAYSVLIFGFLALISFSVPFAFGHPQMLVGTIVNACLFLGALVLPFNLLLPLIFFPSLGLLAKGIVFGPLTMFLIYFLPFIWLSNLVLIFAFKKLQSKGFLISFAVPAFLKSLVLFLSANIYFAFSVIPAVFFQSMGYMQLVTGLLGGCLAGVLTKAVIRLK